MPDVWKERFLAKIETWENEEVVNTRAEIDALKTCLESVRNKINQLNAGFIEESLGLEELRELKNPLVTKKVDLEAKIASLTKGKGNRLEPVRNWIIDANTVGNAALQEDWDEMRKILQKAGSNPILRAQNLHVSFLKPWNLLAEINSATPSLSPEIGESEKWWR